MMSDHESSSLKSSRRVVSKAFESEGAVSETIALKPTRRVVSKAFDGDAAVNALLLSRLNGTDLSKTLTVAEGLLAYGMPQVDVHFLMGLPQKVITGMVRKMMTVPCAGRRPTGMGKLFATPMAQLRASIFLGMIDQLAPNLVKGKEVVTGEHILAALQHTDMVCGPSSDENLGIRYYVTAIHKLSTGALFLKVCGACRVRHIRTREEVKRARSVMIGGRCPYCQYISYLKTRRGRRAVAETRWDGESPQATVDDVAAIRPVPERGTDPRMDIGAASFGELMRSEAS